MKILMVEDDSKIAENVARYLEIEGFHAYRASTLAEAIEVWDSEDCQAMILDWMLPDGAGTTLMRELRNKGERKPILMLTAKTQTEDIVRGFEEGADDYLTKPFDPAVLVIRLKSLIRRYLSGTQTTALHFGEVKLDLNAKRVSLRGKIIDLTPREYDILEYMALKAGATVSRMELMEQVWGDEIDSFSNTIDVHITHLRQKLNLGREKSLIETVKGKGYRLCAP